MASTRPEASPISATLPRVTARKRQVAGVAKSVAAFLRNTPAITRKSYIAPCLFKLFDDGRLQMLWEESRRSACDHIGNVRRAHAGAGGQRQAEAFLIRGALQRGDAEGDVRGGLGCRASR